jgi:hypothetical protein
MYKISLQESDFLTYLLYNASKSRITKVSRIRSWVILVIAFVGIAAIFHFSDNEFMRNYFLAIGLILLVVVPFYQRWRYRHYFIRYIREQHNDKFGKEGTIQFDKDYFIATEEGSELKLSFSEIEEINEIQEYIFIRTEDGESIIIPKEQIDADKFISELSAITDAKGIVWVRELNWKWR